MDARIGLDYIVENREYVSKLGAALDTNNSTVKKQVFELLSALCAYNSEGYLRAIETLEYYKNLKNERYRFRIVISELENATTSEYQLALLAFINCVIISASSLQNRIRIRNEFIGLKVLPVLNNLRKLAQNVGDIVVQLDVFDEQRECDEAQSLQGPNNGINLSSHLDVFYEILRQVADTPQEIPFLSILQHLLRIDPKEPISDIIWDTAEKLVHRATLLENHEDSKRLLRSPSVQKVSCPHCRSDATSPSRKQSVVVPVTTATPPKPPPPPPSVPAPPPPPPPMAMKGCGPPAPPAPPAPSSLRVGGSSPNSRPKTPETVSDSAILLPQQDTPMPKTKMKTINWNKIPPNKVIGKKNIWAIVANNHQHSPMSDIDWNEMEGLFCLQSTSTQGSPKLGGRGESNNPGGGLISGTDTVDRKQAKKENQEITLLDGKRSLNVNIFLKQFRSSNDDIIQLIKDGAHDDIGAEKLRGLLKILPEVDELDMLKTFDGDKARLGNAERFLLQLLEVPNYKLRIESMLLKEEFSTNVSYLDPCINALIYASEDLINNKPLQEVLYMVVVAGNFLNSGGYAGNAAGVKLSSLQKLTDIRANKPGMNLIHYVAMQAEKRNPSLLTFPSEMAALDNATKTTCEQLNNEIKNLDARIKKIKQQVDLPTTNRDIKNQMLEFLQAAESEVNILQSGMKQVDAIRVKLAEFYCEDPVTFKMEECLKIFQNFCEKFKQAVKENEKRRIQEEQAVIRRKQREEQMAKRARQMNQCSTPVSDSENSLIMDNSGFDPRNSPAFPRRRIGPIINADGTIKDDSVSPDITPNGSLRRRRSRVLAEEDDLMEYLRTSGHDRERKNSTYGSLDRSMARRARSGSSSRKRPELLNIDFNADRERPNSPSPLLEKPAPPTVEETKPSRISREWRQKIESWLQSNENDEKQNEEYKRRRLLANNSRRSLENDSESDRSKLDPLPEEKVSTNSPDYKRVYKDWKPSSALQKTDIAGTIEAIEEVQTSKERSTERPSWRSRITNLSNTSSPVESSQNKHPKISSTTSLPVSEEDRRRKNLSEKTAAGSEALPIYIRRPTEAKIEESPVNIEQKSKLPSPTTEKFSTIRDRHDDKYSRIEIDADNIETPPVVRKAMNAPPTDQTNEEDLGIFDRFSAARRTRRYKRPTDYSSGNEETISPASPPITTQPRKSDHIPDIVEKVDDKQERLKRWQEKIKDVTKDETPVNKKIPEKTVAKLEKVGRHISSINQEDVREAIRNLKSPTGTPERIWSPPREIKGDSKLLSTSTTKLSQNHHELNDEGFEETQSLVSDTPSHGKESTSSCNENGTGNTVPSPILSSKQPRYKSVRNTRDTKGPSSSPSPKHIPTKSHIQSLLERNNRRSLEKSRITKTPQSLAPPTVKRSQSQSHNTPSVTNEVERSSSRGSLRSSRSSLNSAVSTNTVVRRLPSTVKHPTTNSNFQRNVTTNSGTSLRGVPASRSSSSGSSIGNVNVGIRNKTTSQIRATIAAPPNKPTTARNAILIKTAISHSPVHKLPSTSSSSSMPASRVSSPAKSRLSGFMRPTASSVTKRLTVGDGNKIHRNPL
ncbi:FHDC1 family protein [Megaselia abdita]